MSQIAACESLNGMKVGDKVACDDYSELIIISAIDSIDQRIWFNEIFFQGKTHVLDTFCIVELSDCRPAIKTELIQGCRLEPQLKLFPDQT